MEYEIRKADQGDVDGVMKQLKDFDIFNGTKRRLYPGDEEARIIVENLINNNYFLVAINKSQHIIGLIACALMPHFLNKNITTFVQLFWWVQKEYRCTRIGLELLESSIAFGKDNSDWLIYGMGPNSTVNDRSLIRRGFVPNESIFLLEV